MTKRRTLAFWLGTYFEQYLIRQRRLSSHTIHSYRDSWKLFLTWICEARGKHIENLEINDVGSDAVSAFLCSLTETRANQASTRNVRLAGIRSFYRWLAKVEPAHLKTCDAVLNLPTVRQRTTEVQYLERDELDAMLASIPTETARGLRNYALLALMYNTGARVQEVLNLRVRDLHLDKPYTVRLVGKGDKERICVMWPETAKWLKKLLMERGARLTSDSLVFTNRLGMAMSRHGVRYVLKLLAQSASARCTPLGIKRIHPHVLRHTAAMHMLQGGVDIATIQNILGHTSPDTTSRYAKANLAMKRAALDKCEPLTAEAGEAIWKQDPDILARLKSL